MVSVIGLLTPPEVQAETYGFSVNVSLLRSSETEADVIGSRQLIVRYGPRASPLSRNPEDVTPCPLTHFPRRFVVSVFDLTGRDRESHPLFRGTRSDGPKETYDRLA